MRTPSAGALALSLLSLSADPAHAERRVLDDFSDPALWTAAPAAGVALALSPTTGPDGGHALRLDFDFQGHGGWAIARRALPLDLPANYRFAFEIRGDALPNTIEFKLIDESGENVWWSTRREFAFPHEWTEIRIPKRKIAFAWGPLGGGELHRAAALEIAITAGQGGKGTVELADLSIEELPPPHPYIGHPTAKASSAILDSAPERAIDGDPHTAWRSAPEDRSPEIAIDFGELRTFGGLMLHWAPGGAPASYRVDLSDDGKTYRTARTVAATNGGDDPLFLPDGEARFVRIAAEAPSHGLALAEIGVEPLAVGDSRNDFFRALAKRAPRGIFPRSFSGEQSYWTVVGGEGAPDAALVGEDGAIEPFAGGFSIEPFLLVGGKRLAWSDAAISHRLRDGDLPIPTVEWRAGDLSFVIEAFAGSQAGKPLLVGRYHVQNLGSMRVKTRLALAIRPFQVNPPAQFLGRAGGSAEVKKIVWVGRDVRIDGRPLRGIPAPDAFGAVTFDEGEIAEHLAEGALPEGRDVEDPFGAASGALVWDLDLPPGAFRDVSLAIPLAAAGDLSALPDDDRAARATIAEILEKTSRDWREKLDRVRFRLPPAGEELARTFRSNLAFILIHRDGPAIRPGSRAYARSWIRDGALTSSALIRAGHTEEARDFLEWFAPFQGPDGRVPCCADARGADPVPEHDSHGELLFLTAEVYRATRDRALLERLWPHVEGAVAYIEKLRQERRTDEYRTPEKLAFFGLLPESISHEGYSSKPVHSYWDDFWALRGLKDAVELAGALGRDQEKDRWTTIRDEFRADLSASIRRVIATRGIGFLPGSADLADFDATSTTIALAPGGEQENLPQKELLATFERYFAEVERRATARDWDAYTPYEIRAVGAFVRLGWRERANALLSGFLKDRRPEGWNGWAEVVGRDPRGERFVGDMPHGWVASDYLRSFLDLFAYERESDGALVLGAGIPKEWLADPQGVSVEGLRTRYGQLDLEIQRKQGKLQVRVSGIELPPGGLVLRLPLDGAPRSVTVNGKAQAVVGSELRVRQVPARIEIGRSAAVRRGHRASQQ